MKRTELNDKLNEVYSFTLNFLNENGYAPTVRDICYNLKIKSTATAYSYLEKLKAKGLLDKSPLKKRAITPALKVNNFKSIPLVGTIRAGSPIFATENLDGYCPLPDDFKGDDTMFALKVTGNSMINAGIYDKDTIIVEKTESADNGQIVVALIDDSATVKRLFFRDGKVILHPENDDMQDMVFDNVSVIGVVKGLIRKF